MIKPVFLITVLLLVLLPVVNGQQSMAISPLNEPIVFDGLVNEAAWNTVESLPMVMHAPVFGKELLKNRSTHCL